MPRIRFIIYSCLLGIGSALVGLVIGFLIKPPSSAVAAILIVIGAGFVALSVLIARRFGGNRSHDISTPARKENTPRN